MDSNNMTTTGALTPNWVGKFTSYQHWVNKAQNWLKSPSHRPAICIDAKGRRCAIGADFMRARDENAFPVSYFWDCEPKVSAAPAQAAAPDAQPDTQPIGWIDLNSMGCIRWREGMTRGEAAPMQGWPLFAAAQPEAKAAPAQAEKTPNPYRDGPLNESWRRGYNGETVMAYKGSKAWKAGQEGAAARAADAPAPAPAPAMGEELPPLPKPNVLYQAAWKDITGHTDDAMRAYGRACMALHQPIDSVAQNQDAQLRAVVKERDELRAAIALRQPGAELSDDRIDQIARHHNLDGSMLNKPRHTYWRMFAKAIQREAATAPVSQPAAQEPFGYVLKNDPWRDSWSLFKGGTEEQAERMRRVYPDVRMIYTAPQPLSAPAPANLSDEQISAIIREVAELPDRDSPADQPEMMLVSGDELRDILMTAAGNSQGPDAGRTEALHAAVAAIYFDDSSDFKAALGTVVRHLDPQLAGDLLGSPKAAYNKACGLLAAVGGNHG